MKTRISIVLKYLLPILTISLSISCASRKDVIYFQDTEHLVNNDSLIDYSLVFQPEDLLSITVSSIDPLAASPFNINTSVSDPIGQANSSGKNTIQGGGGNSQTGGIQPQGYLIDSAGMINFPGLGIIKLAGMNRMKATKFIVDQLQKYLKNPIVNIRLLNFKITVLGDVRTPGAFNIPNERITLPEAIGLAGDMEITGVRRNVLVIRDIGGKRTFTRVDLTTKQVFTSPVYHLKQNDIIYVEPNKSRITSANFNQNTITLASVFITSVSLIITFLTFIKTK